MRKFIYVINNNVGVPFDRIKYMMGIFIEKKFKLEWEENDNSDIVKLYIYKNNVNSYSYSLTFMWDRVNYSLVLPKGRIEINSDFTLIFEKFLIDFNAYCKVYESENLLVKILKDGKIVEMEKKNYNLNEEALLMYIDYKLFELNESIVAEDNEKIDLIENELSELAIVLNIYL